MAQRGPIAKKDEDRQRSPAPLRALPAANPVDITLPDEVLPPAVSEVPKPPSGLKAQTRKVWDAMWSSDVSNAWDIQTDLAAIERYIKYYDEWVRAMDDLKRNGVTVMGSQGQDVMSPVATYVNHLEGRLAKLEDKLGLTPMARARLGLTTAEAGVTAAQLNDMIRRRG